MKKRAVVIALLILLVLTTTFTGCSKEADPTSEDVTKSAFELIVDKGYTGTFDEWIVSLAGEVVSDGKFAYDLAVEKGYTGTKEEWLEIIVSASLENNSK